MSNLYHDAQGGVMLATTAYDSPDASYTFSIAQSRDYLKQRGIETSYLLLQGNCHVDDARNTVVRDFLASDCSDLVFIDADVSWEPKHLHELLTFDCDVVGGVYPYRREGGKENMPVRNIMGEFKTENGLLEVEGVPTGFLKIRRHVLEKMAANAETFSKDVGNPIPLIFERDILNGGRRGGDIGFCMKWREMGGQVFAAADMRLGHCGKQILRDSLSACLRRQTGESLKYVAQRIRDGEETQEDFQEAVRAVQNPWGVQVDVLAMAVLMAGKAAGPILEAGSGLTTVLMAAATDETVWCIEHHPFYAAQTEYLAWQAGVTNIALVTAPLLDGWYHLGDDMEGLPGRFAFALVDGPPRLLGDRMKFFDVFGDRCSAILCDDADDWGYRDNLAAWAEAHKRRFEAGDHRAAVILPKSMELAA